MLEGPRRADYGLRGRGCAACSVEAHLLLLVVVLLMMCMGFRIAWWGGEGRWALGFIGACCYIAGDDAFVGAVRRAQIVDGVQHHHIRNLGCVGRRAGHAVSDVGV